MANKSLNLVEIRLARDNWDKVLTTKMTDDERFIFENKKKAVDMYIDGYGIKIITEETGVNRTRIKRLVERCIKSDENGIMYGYNALLMWKNTQKFNGNFKKLLSQYPSLQKYIVGNYFGDYDYTLEKNMNLKTLHKKFLSECTRLGLMEYEYPFNTTNRGYISLIKYIKQLKNENPNKTIKRENKNVIQKFYSTGYGKKYNSDPIAPYQVVQIDGHKIDMLYSVEVEDKEGNIVRMPATRVWLIAIIDVATRCILGYSLTPNENYNQTDVLKALKNAIMPHEKVEFTLNGLGYPENGGFPSDAIPEAKWAIFDTVMLDNAKSHLAKDVVRKITCDLKCAINFGSVATPETRGIIERFFGTLERGGYHKLPSTTGSNIYDNKRNDPDKESVKYKITYDEIAEITEYLIAEYNNSCHTALENRTPLQVMKSKIQDAYMIPCKVNSEIIEVVKELTNIVIERTVRGGYNRGKRPYINYMGIEYHSDGVSLCMDLINKKIIISVNPDDVSYVKAYNISGEEIGVLTAAGEWGRRPHSLKTREAALKRKNENKALNSPFTPFLDKLEEEYKEKAIESRRARTKADIIRKEKGTPTLIEQSKTERKLATVTDIKKHNSKSFTKEQMKLIDSMSIEEAYEKGLLNI
ncbi:DDE-type integrase/transposase/recombinase [Ruminiclostridium papyrosolvens]|uniref:Integrase catalytic domain-containing protein n=1 Tax=Ruminiclostridium papyrosolvens C7 TaxID=1330534 RepID=U4R0F3_9FIRM|nr:DDE-type integrase/transposase/recombinase [Ruminiclostridium papyrosolvens]EPR10215.1 hypothetical protein L323_14415 [Ruminiclostridium papyrosolvens C7]